MKSLFILKYFHFCRKCFIIFFLSKKKLVFLFSYIYKIHKFYIKMNCDLHEKRFDENK